uniref:Uncharacterized protein n=1 Tax=Laticauda laticaudata TaxID=8630 RepID=A0A8C5SF39_LATLA
MVKHSSLNTLKSHHWLDLLQPSLYSKAVFLNLSNFKMCGLQLLGLCNNFAYVVMLSAAHDILSNQKVPEHNGTRPVSVQGRQLCECSCKSRIRNRSRENVSYRKKEICRK